jgi:hypothetical protein
LYEVFAPKQGVSIVELQVSYLVQRLAHYRASLAHYRVSLTDCLAELARPIASLESFETIELAVEVGVPALEVAELVTVANSVLD